MSIRWKQSMLFSVDAEVAGSGSFASFFLSFLNPAHHICPGVNACVSTLWLATISEGISLLDKLLFPATLYKNDSKHRLFLRRVKTNYYLSLRWTVTFLVTWVGRMYWLRRGVSNPYILLALPSAFNFFNFVPTITTFMYIPVCPNHLEDTNRWCKFNSYIMILASPSHIVVLFHGFKSFLQIQREWYILICITGNQMVNLHNINFEALVSNE